MEAVVHQRANPGDQLAFSRTGSVCTRVGDDDDDDRVCVFVCVCVCVVCVVCVVCLPFMRGLEPSWPYGLVEVGQAQAGQLAQLHLALEALEGEEEAAISFQLK